MYYCAQVNGTVCDLWVQYSGIPLLDTQSAILIGFAFLGLTATAFGVKSVASTIIGK